MSLLEQPLHLVSLLFIISVAPMLIVTGTSFLKIAVVFSLLRNALGVQQVPPNMAMYGLALILTFFIMAPVGMEIQERLAAAPVSMESPDFLEKVDYAVLSPYRSFLVKHASREQVKFFSEIGNRIWPEKYRARISPDSLLVLIPAFTISQLIEAFKIGLLLFLPFLAIDLIVSNILLAMGMMMVSPMTISMPFKLLVFVLVSGWEKLLGQLVLSYG